MSETANLSAEEKKKVMREGDSARARAYRAKDEILTFTYEELASFREESDISKVQEILGEVHKKFRVLDENENDEKVSEEIVGHLKAVMEELGRLGFPEFLKKARPE